MKRRSCDICNLKVFLLFCVVLGHALERDIGYDIAAASLYRVLYLFHMPLFAFVSGLGAKSGRTCFKQARQADKQYLCAQGLVLLICLLVQPGSFSFYLTRPYWHLWYLLSLASWQLLAGGAHLVMAHTGPRTIAHTKVWLLPLALPVAIGGYFFAAKLPVSFLYQAQGYASFGLDGLSGIEARMVCYITAAACSVFVLLLCSKRRCAWTQWGGNTLMPYLLHPVFIGCLTFIPYAPRFAVPVSFVLALIALFSIHLCFKWRGRLFLYTDRLPGRYFTTAAWIVSCKR